MTKRTTPIIKTWHRHTYNGGQTIKIFDYKYSKDYPENSFALEISDDGYTGLSSMVFRIECLKVEDLKNIVNSINEIIKEYSNE